MNDIDGNTKPSMAKLRNLLWGAKQRDPHYRMEILAGELACIVREAILYRQLTAKNKTGEQS